MKYKILYRWWHWAMGWADMLDGLITVLTLGFVHTGFGYRTSYKIAKTRWMENEHKSILGEEN